MEIKLGLGLIGIGREWGHQSSSIPNEAEALDFLQFAVEQGIDFFDTAPAYGASEERLGKFLHSLSAQKRSGLTVATKIGEHWDEKNHSTFVDHSYRSLLDSLERSLYHLGRINILQLHKATPLTVKSDEVKEVFSYARSRGITEFGASISDVETGGLVCKDEDFSVIQLPYNMANTSLGVIIDLAKEYNKMIIVNRPYNMGAILSEQRNAADSTSLKLMALDFVIRRNFRGVILTGTKSPEHLSENLHFFRQALGRYPSSHDQFVRPSE